MGIREWANVRVRVSITVGNLKPEMPNVVRVGFGSASGQGLS